MGTYWDDFAVKYRKRTGSEMDQDVRAGDNTVARILEEFFYFLKDAGFGECPE